MTSRARFIQGGAAAAIITFSNPLRILADIDTTVDSDAKNGILNVRKAIKLTDIEANLIDDYLGFCPSISQDEKMSGDGLQTPSPDATPSPVFLQLLSDTEKLPVSDKTRILGMVLYIASTTGIGAKHFIETMLQHSETARSVRYRTHAVGMPETLADVLRGTRIGNTHLDVSPWPPKDRQDIERLCGPSKSR